MSLSIILNPEDSLTIRTALRNLVTRIHQCEFHWNAYDAKESDPVHSFGLMLPLLAWHHMKGILIDGAVITARLASPSPILI